METLKVSVIYIYRWYHIKVLFFLEEKTNGFFLTSRFSLSLSQKKKKNLHGSLMQNLNTIIIGKVILINKYITSKLAYLEEK